MSCISHTCENVSFIVLVEQGLRLLMSWAYIYHWVRTNRNSSFK